MREKIGAGSEESWKDRELNLRRQARAKVDEHGKPRTAVKQKAYEMEAYKNNGHLDKRRTNNLTEEAKHAAAAAVKVHHMTNVRGSYSARVPRSSLARVRRVLVSHIVEEEAEDQEDEQDDRREEGQQEVEGRIAESQNNHIMSA